MDGNRDQTSGQTQRDIGKDPPMFSLLLVRAIYLLSCVTIIIEFNSASAGIIRRLIEAIIMQLI
jgi:uncharacterized membrane-anchored protein